LGLGLAVAAWFQQGLGKTLDALSELGLAVEARQVWRVLAVLALGCERLRQHPVDGVVVEAGGSRAQQAIEVVRICHEWEASGSGPPANLVMAWQERFGSPLLSFRLA
jgi:hypothetical protein